MRWPTLTLGEVCHPKQYPTLSSVDLAAEGYPVYSANGKIGFYSHFTHLHPTLLVGCRGSCGVVHVTEPKAYANGNAMALDALDSARVDLDFLRNWLTFRGFADVITGSSQPQITRGNITRVEVPLPPLDEQRRIAAILDQADALRRKRRAALAGLERLCTGLFVHTFGDVVANAFQWDVHPLSSVVRRFEGGKNIVSDDPDSENPLRVLKISSIQDDGFRPSESKPLPLYYKPPDSHFLRNGDLLLSRANTTERVGMTVYVKNAPINLVLPDKILRFIWKQPTSSCPEYWLQCFRSFAMRELVGRLASGTSGSMQNISQEKLLAIELGIPPLDLQRAFAARVAEIDRLKAVQKSHLARLDTLFAALQHRAFRGELQPPLLPSREKVARHAGKFTQPA